MGKTATKKRRLSRLSAEAEGNVIDVTPALSAANFDYSAWINDLESQAAVQRSVEPIQAELAALQRSQLSVLKRYATIGSYLLPIRETFASGGWAEWLEKEFCNNSGLFRLDDRRAREMMSVARFLQENGWDDVERMIQAQMSDSTIMELISPQTEPKLRLAMTEAAADGMQISRSDVQAVKRQTKDLPPAKITKQTVAKVTTERKSQKPKASTSSPASTASPPAQKNAPIQASVPEDALLEKYGPRTTKKVPMVLGTLYQLGSKTDTADGFVYYGEAGDEKFLSILPTTNLPDAAEMLLDSAVEDLDSDRVVLQIKNQIFIASTNAQRLSAIIEAWREEWTKPVLTNPEIS